LPKITLSKHFFIMNCAKNNRIELLQRSAQSFYPKDVNVVDVRGNTPLFYAAKRGNFEMCRFLIEKGALINFRCDEGNTAFHMAFQSGRTDTCLYLFDKGADPNVLNRCGQTPLAFGAPSMLKCLGVSGGVAYADPMADDLSFDNRPFFKPAGTGRKDLYSVVPDFASATKLSVRQASLEKTQDRRHEY
jgi:hypothetical protein